MAGVKSVSKAPSSRVGRLAIAEVGSQVDEQKSADKKEKYEVEQLKAEMEDMKKMMTQKAELIKALTAKS